MKNQFKVAQGRLSVERSEFLSRMHMLSTTERLITQEFVKILFYALLTFDKFEIVIFQRNSKAHTNLHYNQYFQKKLRTVTNIHAVTYMYVKERWEKLLCK